MQRKDYVMAQGAEVSVQNEKVCDITSQNPKPWIIPLDQTLQSFIHIRLIWFFLNQWQAPTKPFTVDKIVILIRLLVAYGGSKHIVLP